MGRIRFALLIALIIPTFVAAQSRSGAPHAAPATPHVAAAPRVAAAPHTQQTNRAANRSISSVHSRTGSAIRRRNNFGFSSGQVDFQDAPSLGFDFAHLAAINANHRHRGSRFNGGFPFGFGGFLLSPSVVVEEPPSTQPEVVADDGPSIDDVPGEPQRHARGRPSAVQPEAEPLPSPAPQPDAEQYVIVRRDGSLVFAVGYSWDNSTLRYVTPEGFRRSINSEALDLPATQQFNEQRGLTFRSPA